VYVERGACSCVSRRGNSQDTWGSFKDQSEMRNVLRNGLSGTEISALFIRETIISSSTATAQQQKTRIKVQSSQQMNYRLEPFRYRHKCSSEGIMQDVDDEVIGCFSNELDIGYEEEMSSRIEWLDDGHFITQDFLADLNDGSRLQLPEDRPLRVHTFIRDQDDTSYQHPAHPFTALVHMLDAACENSDVFCSAPYLTLTSTLLTN